MINQMVRPTPIFMMTPAICMSVSADMPEQPRDVVVERVQRVAPNVRNDAGTVGTTDCRNRNSMRPSGWQARHLGQRAQQRHPHDERRHEDERVDAEVQERVLERGVHDERRVRDDDHDVEHDRRRDEPREVAAPSRSNHRGDRSQRASHVGVPISISGAAIIEYVTCCTMCTEKR